ncbi:MAG: ATP-grasp domain-containing protein [Candidatus Adiutrix sp.]|jgi:hypothetical protein|nr:ATP-grasp domain-containing protein [Candidatus Adiutrix sp.]
MERRVWLNHWFSTAYHIINMIREDAYFRVVGSGADAHRVYRAVCDEWHEEPPWRDGRQYVNFCLEFCASRKIDVFVPQRGLQDICGRLADFEKAGVRVLLEADYGLVSTLNDKAATYEFFRGTKREGQAAEAAGAGETLARHLPPYRVVNDAAGFRAAYAELKRPDNRLCLKFSRDVGAASFRVIDDRLERDLALAVGAKISYAAAERILANMGSFPDLMVMPYLTGREVSVDCLKNPGGDIFIPRFKSGGRLETIEYDEEIIEICENIQKRLAFEQPYNIQFKYHDGLPYLLEINARMSGGLHLSYAGTKINIPNIAVNRLIGINKKAVWDKTGSAVSYVETPVVLSRPRR